MNEEPDFRNHHRRHEESESESLLPSDLEGLVARLTADGAAWQGHLPDAARVAERIRAIPHDSLRAASAGDFSMSADTNRPSPQDHQEGRRALRAEDPRRAPPRPPSARGRILGLAAAVVVVALFATVVIALANQRGLGAPPAPTQAPPTPVATATGVSASLQVTSVSMAVAPASIAGLPCGTTMTVTYTATIHVAPNSGGGTVQFNYTINNGRGQTPASVTFGPGETAKTYAFTWSGALPADHTAPGLGGIQVTSPNQLTSPLIAPAGQCTPAPPTDPNCGSNFSGHPYQSTLTTDFGAVPLPTLSRTVPDDASGGQRGFDICSAGTAASVSAYMEQNLPAYGWTLVSNSGGTESWQNSNGTISWRVSDPLQWIVYWHVPLG